MTRSRWLGAFAALAAAAMIVGALVGFGVGSSKASPRQKAEAKANAVLAAHHVAAKASCVHEREFPNWICSLTGPGVGARAEYNANHCVVFGVNADGHHDGKVHVWCEVGERDQFDFDGTFAK